MERKRTRKFSPKNIAIAVLILALAILAISSLIFAFKSLSSDKLVCESKTGNITISYNDKGITGYNSDKIDFNLNSQKAYARELGIENYIKEFKVWFDYNYSGTCQ